ncbi:efflux transporter outer membrane subunit [Pseudomonas sp. Marseille-Q8238]
MKRHLLACSVSLVGAFGLTACGVGPDFGKPQSDLGAQWSAPAASEAVRSRTVSTAMEARWWDSFADPVLSSLIQRAASGNLDLRVAASRLEQSRAARRSIAAERLPSVNAGAGYSRTRNSQDGLSDPSGRAGKEAYSLWQGGFDTGWELDLWGRVRREVEAADALVQGAEEQRHGVLLAVLAETASDYIQLRGAQSELAITRQNLDIALRTLELNRTRLGDGVATQLEVAEAAAQVAAIEARVPPLQQREAQLINALSLLLARPPQALHAELSATAAIPAGPRHVPVGLPSELAERRPDIRRAEAELHAATASIGVAQGDFYPRITLSGNVGFQALQLADFGSWSSRTFAFGPAFSVPLFDGGRLRGTLQLREAQQQEAAITYQKTVLGAWHEVDNALSAYQAEQRRHASLEQAVSHSRLALHSAEEQYAQGTVDFLNVLSVQNALLANQAALVESTAGVSLALVDLYKSLGGGWQAAPAG